MWCNHGYGTYYSYSKDYLISTWKDDSRTYFHGCFATYFSNYSSRGPLYFYFPALPTWYKKVVEEFNSKFKNIKYVVDDDKTIWGYYLDDTWKGRRFYIQTYYHPKEYNPFKLSRPVFHIDFSKEYTEKSVKFLTYSLSIFMRMISLPEDWNRVGNIEIRMEDPQENYIKYIMDLNNKFKGYRTLSEHNISEEDFLNFDNPERINKGSNLLNYGKQTRIFSIFRRDFEGVFRIAITNGWRRLRYDYKSRIPTAERILVNSDSVPRALTYLTTNRGKTFPNKESAELTLNDLNNTVFGQYFSVKEYLY